MTWNYRVCKETKEAGSGPVDIYSIREVYYNKEGKIYAYSENPIAPYGESPEELEADLELMLRARTRPILDLAEVEFADAP